MRDPDIESYIKTVEPVPDEYTVTAGTIPSTVSDRSVAVSIIEARQYPYAVLGAACAERREEATLRGYHESLLSWGASLWMRSSEGFSAPRWDFGELHRRATSNSSIEAPVRFETIDELMDHGRAQLKVVTIGKVTIALVHSSAVSTYSTHNLASLVKAADEMPVVTTEANL